MRGSVQDTLDAAKAAILDIRGSDNLRKAFNQALGLVNYDLQAPAIKLYPVLSPLRNRCPRVAGRGDTATRWKTITGINTAGTKGGVSEGQRGGVITTTTASLTAAYIGLGLEDYVTFDADYAAEYFENVKADATLGLLQSFMIMEENMLLGGNASTALGTTPTPSLTAGSAGSMATQAAASVICVALSYDGYKNATVAGGVVQTIARTNADGSSDTLNGGTAIKSANATVSVTGTTGSIAATVTAVKGAFAYAWYCGATAGSEKLAAITTINSVVLTAYATTTQAASALASTDYSDDATYQYDGFLYQALKSGSNAYFKSLATGTAGTGTQLTSDGAGGITELNDMFQTMYDTLRLGPTRILVSSRESRNISNLVVKNGGAPLIRLNMDAQSPHGGISAGAMVTEILNPVTGEVIPMETHPYLPQGTLLAISDRIPYPLTGVGNVYQIKERKAYYATEWPLKTRKWEYGVYNDSLFQHYFPASMGIIANIAP